MKRSVSAVRRKGKASIHYNWRKIDGYNAPITVVISQRGLGKTFGKVYEKLKKFVDTGKRFIYVVETLEDVKTLTQNSGERFFAGIEEYLSVGGSKRKERYYNKIFKSDAKIEDGETDLVDKANSRVHGGTIKVNHDTAGYLIAINAYANLKRNNFKNIDSIIIDEFIPEEIDIRHLKMARKVVSIVQSIARTKDIKIYMLGNAIRLDDIMLTKLHLDNLKLGEIRKIKDEYGLLVIAHYVDPSEYEEFTQKNARSVAGRLAKLLGEDNLDKNVFKGQLSDALRMPREVKSSHLVFCLHGESGSVRINVTKDHSEYYCLVDYGTNARHRYTFDQKYTTEVVEYRPEWRDIILSKYTKGLIKFESSAIHLLFRSLMKLDTNV